MIPSPNPAIAAAHAYRAGRTAADVERELGIVGACRLASNELPFGPLPAVAAAISDATDAVNRYPPVRARALAERLAVHHRVAAEQVIVGPGSAGLLWQIAVAYLGPGRTMVAPAPSFEGYRLVAELTGTRLIEVPLTDHTVSVDALLGAITDDTTVVVIAEPNNPTGTSVGAAGVAELVAGTRGRCVLVLDEAYAEFADLAGAAKLATREPHVVVLRTFSKAHGLASLRIGYAVGDAAIVSFVDRAGPPFSVTAQAEAAALAALSAPDELAVRVGAVVAERARVTARLHELGIPCVDSRANFVFLPLGAAAVDLARQLETRGVITRPVTDAGLRVSIGSSEENSRFVQCLTTVLTDAGAR